MKNYKFKGKVITANSRKEAISIFAKSQKVTALTELSDDVYEKYGNDYLLDWKNGEEAIHEMDELDEELSGSSASEIIMDAYCGYDFVKGNDNTKFNPNEDYFAINSEGNLVSIRSGYRANWLRYVISESNFIDWLLENNHKEEALEPKRDEVEEKIRALENKGKMFGFDFEDSSDYSEIIYDRDNDKLTAGDVTVDYDYDFSLDSNLQNLYEQIVAEHPDLELS